MVLPSSGAIDTQAIETEFQLGTAVTKRLSNDLGPLIAITATTTISQGSSFYGKAYGQAVTSITQGTTTSSSITLNWSGGAGATSFSITSTPATTTQTASASGYNFTGLAASTAYTFTIVSKNAQGVSGGSATSGSFTTSPSSPVNITGVVTTFAGTYNVAGTVDGTGTAAQFFYPRHIITDGAGNLYVSQFDAQKLRKIVISTKAVTTIATLRIYGMAYDGAGNIYYATFLGGTVRKYNLNTNTDSFIAGSGATGFADGTGAGAVFNYPLFVAYYAGNLYVTDIENHRIRKVTTAGVVTTLAGNGTDASVDGTGTGASFSHPYGIVSDGAGNLYNVDERGLCVRKTVISTGVVTTIAGLANTGGFVNGVGSAARFNYPNGLDIDPTATYLYIADNNNTSVRKIVISTNTVSTPAGTNTSGYVDATGSAARFNIPFAVCVAGSTLYVNDYFNQLIRAVT